MTNYQPQSMFEGLPELLTFERAADACSVCSRTLRREVERGNLKAVHIGRSVRIPRVELLRFVEGATNND